MRSLSLLVLVVLVLGSRVGFAQDFQSHPALRPLPKASDRPLSEGPAFHVDSQRGSDDGAGTKDAPWKSVSHALKQIEAGATLYLRGGTYYERLYCSLAGTKEKPITIRSWPGELAVIDGSFRDFFESPGEAWQPYKEGSPGELSLIHI